MLSTFLFVMTGFSDCTDRAAIDAFPTCSVGVIEAVSLMVCVRSWCGFDGYFCYNRTCPHCFAFSGDQAITQTEGAQTCSVSCMTFRPRRGVREPLGFNNSPIRCQHWGDSCMVCIFQAFYHMVSQRYVEFLTVYPDSCPFFRRICLAGSICLANQFSLGKDPGNDRQLLCAHCFIRTVLIKNLPRS